MSKRRVEDITVVDNDNKRFLSDNVALNSVTNVDSLDQKLKAAIDVLETGNIDENLINSDLPGFKEIAYQGVINDIRKKNYFSAKSGYINKNTIEFEVKLPEERAIIPSEMVLELPIIFYNNSAKAAKLVTTHPVNGWPFYLIEDVEIFRYGTVDPITPQRDISVHEYFLDEAKHIPKKFFSKEVRNLQYIPTPPGKFRRTANSDTAGDRTDANILARDTDAANFHNRHITNSLYKIPVKFLTNFGKINEVITHSFHVVITLRRDMSKIFDRTDKSDNTGPVIGFYEFHREPRLHASLIRSSNFYKYYKNQLFQSIPTYNYGNTEVYTQRIKEIPTGTIETEIEFDSIGKQFDFIQLSLQPRESVDHNNQYSSYNYETANTAIKKLSVKNIEKKINTDDYQLDFTDEADKYIIYKNYLSYNGSGPSCQSGLVDFVNSPLFNEDLLSEQEYFLSGQEVYIDLRNSCGMNELPDAVQRSDGKIRVMITLKDAVTTPFVVNCMGISHYASYRSVFKDGQKRLVFSTLHAAGTSNTAPAIPYRSVL